MKKYLFLVSNGQSLIEVLIAFGVSIIIIAAAVLAVLFALSNTQTSKNQNLATQYAQEGVENIRQRNLSGVQISGGEQCLDANMLLTNKLAAVACPVMSATIPFLRQVTVQNVVSGGPCGDAQQVTVSVFWSDNKCLNTNNLYCEEVKLVSCLSVSPVSGP